MLGLWVSDKEEQKGTLVSSRLTTSTDDQWAQDRQESLTSGDPFYTPPSCGRRARVGLLNERRESAMALMVRGIWTRPDTREPSTTGELNASELVVS